MSGTFLGTGLGGGFFPAAAAASPVTPPAPTSEAVASGGSVTGWTFSAFTDPDGRIASYSATLTAVVGSGSLSGSGLGPYSLTGTADGDAYTVELDALDSGGAVLATATHSVAIASGGYQIGDLVSGGHLRLDGVDEYVNLGRVPALDFAPSTDSFSIAAWFQSVSGRVILSNFRKTGPNRFGWFLDRNSTTINLNFYGATIAGAQWTGIAIANEWRHVLVTWNTTTARLWVDGVEQTQKTPSYPNPVYDATNLVVVSGYNDNSLPTAPFNGDLKQIAVWSDDQSANAGAIYNSGSEHDLRNLADPPDLIYMPLNVYGDSETTANGISDLSGNNYDGTGANLEGNELEAPTYIGDSR